VDIRARSIFGSGDGRTWSLYTGIYSLAFLVLSLGQGLGWWRLPDYWMEVFMTTAMLVLVTVGVHQTRRYFIEARRWHKGLCLKCGYDRDGLAHGAPCPECGLKP
jgi:hypothetical protein